MRKSTKHQPRRVLLDDELTDTRVGRKSRSVKNIYTNIFFS